VIQSITTLAEEELSSLPVSSVFSQVSPSLHIIPMLMVVLGQAFTRNWWELFICRCLLGFGMGMKITTIPIMTAET
jgi:MFS family permease